MSDYDVIVVGAGPGGYVCAIRAAQLGQKTAIVDKQWLGGVCLNVGCIPSKALLKNAEVAHTLRERGKEFGFSFENLTLDYSVAFKRSRQVSDRLTRGVGFLMKKNKVDVYMGAARISPQKTVMVTGADGNTQELQAKNIVIATGSHTALIPGVKVDGERIMTYLEAIMSPQLPSSAIIIGAGAIGVEFATVWNSYGIDVTIVEMLPRIVPLEDEEISAELNKAFNKRGIKTLVGTRVLAVETTEKGVAVKVAAPDGEKVLEAGQVLVAIGFKPNSADLGLEALGVQLSPRGVIEIDERMATNVPGVLGHRRCDREAASGARGIGARDYLRRKHSRSGDDHPGLYDDAAGHLLQPSGGILRPDRSPGQRKRVRAQGWALPLPGQWQGARIG